MIGDTPGMYPQVPQTDDIMRKLFLYPLLQSLSFIVLAVWNYTLHTQNDRLQQRVDELTTVNQAQNRELITVLTEIKNYMDDQKYQTRIAEIRNK